MKFFPLFILSVICVSLPEAAFTESPFRGFNLVSSVHEEDIEALDEYNVNLVRYQLADPAAVDIDNTTDYLAWLNDQLDHFDEMLPLLEAQGAKVILDLHTAPGGFETVDELPQLKVFTQAWAREALIQSWQMMATRYAGNTSIHAFEILSEPGTGTTVASSIWRELAVVIVQDILSRDATRKIVVPGDYAKYTRLAKISKRLRTLLGKAVYRANIIHTIHLYTPYAYVKQGLDGLPENLSYPSVQFTAKALKQELRKIRRVQQKLKLRNLMVGEFSVVRWAPGAANYLNDLLAQFERYRWGWTYHIFREGHEWSVEHTSDKEDTSLSNTLTDRAYVLKAYFAENAPLS